MKASFAIGLLASALLIQALPSTPIQQAAPAKPTTNYVVITYNVTNYVSVTNWPTSLVIQDLYLPTNALSVLSKP